jgi:hypothetical protein
MKEKLEKQNILLNSNLNSLIKSAINKILETEFEKNEYKKGKITKILHQGNSGDGFITDGKMKSYYFKNQWINTDKRKISENAEVIFKTRTEIIKEKKKYSAYDIFIL